jgi:hypothetical protein
LSYHDDNEHMRPRDPLDDPPEVVTADDVARLHQIRRAAPWYAENQTPSPNLAASHDDVLFLLGLVNKLLSRTSLPGEELYPYEDDMPRYDVRSGPSLYMCGHGEWHVLARGRPGVRASFTAGLLDATRIAAIINRPDDPDEPVGHVLVTVARYTPASGSVYYRWRCSCNVNGEPLPNQAEARAAWVIHRDRSAR